jgi:hypothetical protein
MTSDGEATWNQRMQGVANDAMARVSESTAAFQRMMLAVAAADLSSERLTDELTRVGQEQALDAYGGIAEVNARTLSRFAELVSSYQSDYAAGLLSETRLAAIGRPPAPPSAPAHADATEWLFWYQRYIAWVTEQQTWSARLYRALVDEAATGGIREDAVRSYGTAFVRDRLPAYLADVVEASFDSFCDLLAVNDGSVQSLTDAMAGGRSTAELTVNVEGVAGSTVSTGLAIENNHSDTAAVSCVAIPADGFGITVTPEDVQLPAGETQKVMIYVTLPDEATEETVAAGAVRVTGHGDEDLAVHVRADVTRRTPGALSVRVLDTDT